MPLNPALLAEQMKAAIGTPADDAAAQAIFANLASAICSHIQANAVVTVTVTGVAAVTSAPGSAPVTGTGTGTIA